MPSLRHLPLLPSPHLFISHPEDWLRSGSTVTSRPGQSGASELGQESSGRGWLLEGGEFEADEGAGGAWRTNRTAHTTPWNRFALVQQHAQRLSPSSSTPSPESSLPTFRIFPPWFRPRLQSIPSLRTFIRTCGASASSHELSARGYVGIRSEVVVRFVKSEIG